MYDYFFTFRSVTAATQASRALERAGISTLMVRTPAELRQMGCGYSLRLQTESIARAAWLLRAEQLPMRKVYLQKEDGSLEEIAL